MTARAGFAAAGDPLPLPQRSLTLENVGAHMGVPPLPSPPVGIPFVPYFLDYAPDVLSTAAAVLPVRCVLPHGNPHWGRRRSLVQDGLQASNMSLIEGP
jgi:hypothetical protein